MYSSEVKSEEKINTSDFDDNVINAATCQLIGQMINVPNLNVNILKPCIEAVNNLAKRLVGETVFVTRRGKRSIPISLDVSTALKYRKISTSFSNVPFEMIPLNQNNQDANGNTSIFYPEDEEIDLKELVNKIPSKISYESSMTEHWLSIYSVQPATPENPTSLYIFKQKKILQEKMYSKSQIMLSHNYGKKQRLLNGNRTKGSQIPTIVINVRPRSVGIEHQVYFKTLTEACVGNDENARNSALMTIKNNATLDHLMPRLMDYIAQGINMNIMYENLTVLTYLVRIVRSLLDNPHVDLIPYLRRISSALLSVVLCGNICLNPITDNYFELRKFAGKVINSICERQETGSSEQKNWIYYNLINNIKQAINPDVESSNSKSTDFTMRLNTLCGAVLCLSELSSEAIRKCLVSKIRMVCQFLTNIIKLKGSSLLGTEDKAIISLKDILLDGRVVMDLYEYRLAKNLETSLDACIVEFGDCMGIKYHDLFREINLAKLNSM